jgi:hypothetical protein
VTRELARFVPARGKLAVMVAGLVVFTGLAAWLLRITPAEAWEGEEAVILRLALWAVVVLCPVYAVDLAIRLARGTPTLIATGEGLVLNAAFGVSTFVPWDDIEMIAPVEMSRKLWLGIYLRHPVETLAHLGTVPRLMLVKSHAEGVPSFAFRAIRLGRSPADAAELLERLRRRGSDLPEVEGKGKRTRRRA